eukprot:CAMPEP_0204348896 /NCGR_PEP_ID=MMETSP0469-20131031/29086_1 /ASSEMBLY_ACC=CAM_ASM_000384 /TAXON_ID=2969 /ORGANISM="Oxyrrhis marina" /LENGTH=258 /DNA_ID=CAMNT_0051334969 /DNA_START=24 /DNA_END=800 /DNA_ORIENTATION=-
MTQQHVVAELVVSGAGPETSLPLYLGLHLVGRRPDDLAQRHDAAPVTIHHASVSRGHALISVEMNEAGCPSVKISDAGSKNGTSVVGVGLLTLGSWAEVTSKSTILLGDLEIGVRSEAWTIEEAKPEPKPAQETCMLSNASTVALDTTDVEAGESSASTGITGESPLLEPVPVQTVWSRASVCQCAPLTSGDDRDSGRRGKMLFVLALFALLFAMVAVVLAVQFVVTDDEAAPHSQSNAHHGGNTTVPTVMPQADVQI